MKLSDLSPAQSGKIRSFNQLSDDVRKKMMVMGLLPDTVVTMVRRAPMGDPLQIEVRGVNIAVRKRIASQIDVECI